MNEAVDHELRAIHLDALNIYNRETMIVRSNPTSTASIKATNFLAGQATMFADAALILLEDTRQPVNVPAALLRTCLEAQARANHIIAVVGAERESRASELVQLMEIGHEYYKNKTIELMKAVIPDETKLLARDRPYFPAMKSMSAEIDTSNLKELKKQYERINKNWSYGKVIERDKFGDPKSLTRSEAQPLQPMLNLAYMQSCSFVHSDPASLKHSKLLSPVTVAYTAVLAEVIAILCFFVAVGKERDQELVNIKKRIKAFDVNERILPKRNLSPS